MSFGQGGCFDVPYCRAGLASAPLHGPPVSQMPIWTSALRTNILRPSLSLLFPSSLHVEGFKGQTIGQDPPPFLKDLRYPPPCLSTHHECPRATTAIFFCFLEQGGGNALRIFLHFCAFSAYWAFLGEMCIFRIFPPNWECHGIIRFACGPMWL